MSKLIAISNEITEELNRLKGEKESYSKVIKRLLANQPKSDAERIYEVFDPFMEAICKIIDQKMQHPIEIFRVICIRFASEKYYSREKSINRLVEFLEGFSEEKGYLKELKEDGNRIQEWAGNNRRN